MDAGIFQVCFAHMVFIPALTHTIANGAKDYLAQQFDNASSQRTGHALEECPPEESVADNEGKNEVIQELPYQSRDV